MDDLDLFTESYEVKAKLQYRLCYDQNYRDYIRLRMHIHLHPEPDKFNARDDRKTTNVLEQTALGHRRDTTVDSWPFGGNTPPSQSLDGG